MFLCLFMSLCSVLHCFVLILSLISCLVTCCFVGPLSALSSLTSLSSVFLIYLPAVYPSPHYHVYKCPTLVLRCLLSHCCLFPPCQHAGNGLQPRTLQQGLQPSVDSPLAQPGAVATKSIQSVVKVSLKKHQWTLRWDNFSEIQNRRCSLI